MRSSTHLRRANQTHCAEISERRATKSLLANAPITIRQLRDCVHIAVSMAAGFLEDSNQSLARVQGPNLASAPPQMNVPHNLFAQLQCLLLLFCADILDSHAQSDQRLCCLNAASHDKLIAAIQPSQKFLHSAPSRQFPWRQAKAAPNVPLRKVSSGKSLVSGSSPPGRWLNAACC